MNKKSVWLLVGVIIIVVLVSLVMSRGNQTKSSNQPVKIGVALPLSGDFASFGESIKNGMEIARQEFSDKGKSITIAYEDACVGKDAVSAITKLIVVDKVQIIGGSFCLIGLIPSISILEQNKIIAFNTAANPDAVLNNKYVVSTNFSIDEEAKKIANYISATLKAKRVALVTTSNDFGKSYQTHITEGLAGGPEIVSSQTTSYDEKDFRTVLAQLKQKNPDAIALIEFGPALAAFLKQAKEFGINVPIIGYYEDEDPSLLASMGSAAEGFMVSSADPVYKSPALDSFIEKYTSLYKSKPDTFALNAYDALNIQVSALEKCGGEYVCLMEYFKSVKNYKGLSGDITIKQDGSASKPTVFKIVKDGKFVEIK